MKRLRFSRLSTQLVFWFLVISIVPVAIVVTLVYFDRAASMRQDAWDKLRAVRDLKVIKLNTWFEHRLSDMKTLAGTLHLQTLEPLFETMPTEARRGRYDEIRSQLALYVRHYGEYREVFVIDGRTGRTAVSTKPQREGIDRSRASYFRAPMATGQPHVSEVYLSPREQVIAMELAVPVPCRTHAGSHVAAVIAARLNLAAVYGVLIEPAEAAHGGETLIVDSDGMALSELRGVKDAPLRRRVRGIAATRAASGETGIVEGPDYRGVEVLAAYAHVPRLGWGLVVKEDLAALYAPLHAMLWRMLLLLLAYAVVVSALAVLLGRSLARPVLHVAEVARRIRGGEVRGRCRVEGTVEVATMAAAINEMADALVADATGLRAAADLSEAMVVAATVPEFAGALLRRLLDLTGAYGAVFLRQSADQRRFERVAGVGPVVELPASLDPDLLGRELGGVLARRSIVHLTSVPEGSILRRATATGANVPREILAVPLLVKDRVAAVLALATSGVFSREQRTVVEQTWVTQSTALANLLAGERTELMAEELRARNEVLGRTNEELRRQARALEELALELEGERLRAEQADRLKSEFLANVSHELRTPLSSVLSLCQLMLSRGPGKNPRQEIEFLQIIERNGRQLLDLINNILDLSRIEAGRVDLDVRSVRPDAVVRVAVQTIRPIAEQRGLALDLVAAPGLPALHTDEGKLGRILLNILGNAVKFTDAGGIEVRVAAEGGWVSFSVKDTGVGIAKEHHEVIFEEFRQVDGSTTRRHGGSGLGLAISRKLAVLLGGEVSVESEPGQGSTFTLTLPLERQVAAGTVSRMPEEAAAAGEVDASP